MSPPPRASAGSAPSPLEQAPDPRAHGPDPDARLALRATGRLRELNEAGVLRAADVHVAARLGALAGETDPDVLVALALAVRGARNGSVALRLAEVAETVLPDEAPDGTAAVPLTWPEPDAWLAAVRRSPLAGGALRVEDDLVWLARYWRQEREVADDLLARAARVPEVDLARLRAALARLWPGTEPDDQRRAAAVCALSRVAVLGGGPGTGKTTTVARLLVALREAAPPGAAPPRAALAAPTGRAAARLLEAVQGASGALPEGDREFLAGLEASTLHRLLGMRRGQRGPWHHAGNRLPHDLVVVDEASMVSLTLTAALLAALRPSARLVLVGDPDQLASVEAGAVLADLVGPAPRPAPSPAMAARLRAVLPHDQVGPGDPGQAGDPGQPGDPGHSGDPGRPGDDAGQSGGPPSLSDGVVLLRRVHRFAEGGPIAALASAIRAREADAAVEALRAGSVSVAFDEVPDDGPVEGEVLARLRAELVDAARPVVAAAGRGDALTALDAVARHRLLCAHRQGPRGVAHWARLARRWVVEELDVAPRRDGMYAGLALLVTANDPDNRLWNGDTGVVVDDGEGLVAAFAAASGPVVLPLGRLGDVAPLYASTVHRAQGSQASQVTLVLPPSTSPLGTRETLYTGVTRAVDRVRVVGSEAAVRAAVLRRVARATGLGQRLARGGR